ncbi:MAG: beta-ketoacyl-ACP reductase [Deltaproteobacteria bacterium]|nr:MAG: beta-ketoacyl-ACP reductase [Deltaproteobacteria bacterium]
MDFEKKVVIITGGTRGIGRAISLSFAKQGALVIVNFLKDEASAEKLVEDSKGFSGKVITFKGDISNKTKADELIQFAWEKEKRIDILVNNAGLFSDNYLMLMSDENWDKVIKSNLFGTFYCCRSVIRKMIALKKGKIINISSVSGILGTAGQTNYAAAKAGIIGFSKSLAREVGRYNIYVNVVAPGIIETELISSMPKEKIKKIIESTSLGRIGKVEEVANAVLFLASEKSDYITGQILVVDGGIL